MAKGKEPEKNVSEDVKEKEPTISELLKKISDQDRLIVGMEEDNKKLAEINRATSNDVNDLKEQLGNLTNILGNLANRGESEFTDDSIDYTDKNKLTELIDLRTKEILSSTKKKEEEEIKQRDAKCLQDYKSTVEELLDEECNPKGERLSATERKDIIELLKTKEFNVFESYDGGRQARKNFKNAYKRYYGLDKKNMFKGSDPSGIGVGGDSKIETSEKDEYVFGESTLSQLSKAGITKDEAERLMKRRKEREALV